MGWKFTVPCAGRVFFLLADWAVHWQDIFKKKLGLCGDTAKLFMQDMHTRLVYFDTGVVKPPPSTSWSHVGVFRPTL